jgi:orotidine-5'-phosphate decarboxylase
VSEARAPVGPRIIVALDFAEPRDALELAHRFDAGRCRLKVGKQLFTRAGPDIVRRLQDDGFEIFLDLKFHDIPNTVAGACGAAAELGVWMLNVHAAGGRAMMQAARDTLAGASHCPLLIAVTLLTSLDGKDLEDTGVSATPDEQVARLAGLASDCGLDGVVCSPRELGVLAGRVPASFLRVTPGVRPEQAAVGDQVRIASPARAIADGATYLVIGRPITQAPDPAAALAAIEAEIAL